MQHVEYDISHAATSKFEKPQDGAEGRLRAARFSAAFVRKYHNIMFTMPSIMFAKLEPVPRLTSRMVQ